ncbi:MAG: competence/damage-inducible protein A [Aestuariivirgaceae bacterium]
MTETEELIPTAAVLLIGDEILSGRTKDKNLGHIAEFLTARGIDLKEARLVADDEADIAAALNALRSRYTYVFTTGGIGPTHDDITADAVAKAFGVPIDHDPRAVAILEDFYREVGREATPARMRMARMPHGSELIANPVSRAPGFQIGNVFVMAGVPKIMQAMLEEAAPKLRSGIEMASATITVRIAEGDLGGPLADIQARYDTVSIGSYPFEAGSGFGANIILRSRDADRLAAAEREVQEMVKALTAAGKLNE